MRSYFICITCCLSFVGLKAEAPLTDSLANALNMQANNAVQSGESKAALKYYNTALQALIPSFTDTILLNNPDWKLLENSHNQSDILALLEGKATASVAFFGKYGDAEGLRKAYETFELTDQLMARVKMDNEEPLGRERMVRIYEKAIETASTIFDKTKNDRHLEQAFQWAERCKTLLLTDLHRSFQTADLQAIPDSLLAYGRALRHRLADLEKTISRTIQPIFKDSLQTLQSEYETFKTQLKKEFPKYFTTPNHEVVSLGQLQGKVLKGDMFLLEYFVAEETIFLFEITKDKINLSKIPLDFSLEKWVDEMLEASSTPDSQAEEYAEVALKLFSYLRPIPKQENCIIIPDGVLHELPFELLLTEKSDISDFKNLPYLLRKANISYAYSATDLAKRYKGLPINIGKQFLGISNNDPDNKNEVLQVKRKFKGETVFDVPSIGVDFEEKVSKFDLIHLAVQADEKGLELDEKYVSLSELFRQKMDASMVVLNSYEGTVTEMEQSLSQESESVILARWNTENAVSADIMKRFYTNLGDKMPKNEALRQAKLDYLAENYVNEKMAHPYYWAAWSAFGNTLPLEIQILIEDFIWLAVALILLLLVIAYFLRRNSSDIPVGTITNFPARG